MISLTNHKRILLIGGNFYPEPTGIGKYNGEMIDMWARQGHQCTVITSYPYYPYWKVQEPYAKRARWYSREEKISSANTPPIEIYRCPQYVPSIPTAKNRMLLDFSFCFSSSFKIFQLLFRKRYDIVIAVVPCFQVGLLATLYKKIRGAKFIYHIQDLQIDAAKDLKMIKSKFILDTLFGIERYILKNADMVSSISIGMINRIKEKYNRDVMFFPNWVDTKQFYPLQNKAALKEQFNFQASDKVILYSGAIGEKQGLEAIMYAAQSLKQSQNIKFVICGSGPYTEKLKEMKSNLDLKNVSFLKLQPIDKLNYFLNMADIHLVLQKANVGDFVMPSKLTTILSVGGVAIITANKGTSLYDIVESNQMGILIEPENLKALISSINLALKNGNEGIHQNARMYAEKSLSVDNIFDKYINNLQ